MDPYDLLASRINGIYPIVLIPFGTVGNLITLIVYNRKAFAKSPFGFYNSCLMIVNTLTLYVGALKFFLFFQFGYDVTVHSETSCKLLITGIYILPQLSSWIIVLISFERLAAIKFFNISHCFKKRSFQILTVSVCALIIVLINTPSFVYLKIKKESWQDTLYLLCVMDTPDDALITDKVRDMVDLMVYTVLPFCFMTTCSLLISRTIITSKRKLRINRDLRREYQLSSTLLFINFMFLLLNLPICIVMVIRNMMTRRRSTADFNSPAQNLAYSIANVFAYINFSNPVLINLFMNQLFRQEFFDLFNLSLTVLKKYVRIRDSSL